MSNADVRVIDRLDEISPPTVPFAFNGQRITGLANPIDAQDAATKAYADAFTVAAGAGLAYAGNTLNVGANNGIIANADDVSLTGQALALHNLATAGFIARTGVDTVAARTLAGTPNQVNVSNPDGVAGNPTFSLPQDLHAASNPTFGALTIDSLSIGNPAPTNVLDIKKTVNSNLKFSVINESSGASAFASFTIGRSVGGDLTFDCLYTGEGNSVLTPLTVYLTSSPGTTGGIYLGTNGPAPVRFQTAGVVRMTIDPAGPIACTATLAATGFMVGLNQVIGARGAAVADPDGTLAGVTASVLDILARMRTHGLIS